MASISSIGLGSGLEVEKIITQLVALETSRLTPLKSQASLIQSRISTVSQLKSLTSTLQDKLKDLADASKWSSATKATSSNATAITALTNTSSDGTTPKAVPGSYNISVTQLATAQSITSGRFASDYQFSTGGTLNVKTATGDVDVTIAADASLADVASSINQANAGVTASIMNDGTGQRLIITSTATGASNGFSLGGISELAYDQATGTGNILGSGATKGSQTAALDAIASINGVSVTSASNTFSETIQGVSFTALTTGSSTINVVSDTDTLKTRITDFVAAYNAVNSLLSNSVKYDQDTDVAGVFQADSTMTSLQSAMRGAFAGSAATSTVYKRLIDIGIDMKKGGTLEIDDSKLSKALSTNSGEVAKFFSEGSDGLADKLRTYTSTVLSFDGVLENKATALSDASKRNTTEQDKVNDRAARVEARLRAQYTALDAKMSSLTALNTYITQQVAQWNKSSS